MKDEKDDPRRAYFRLLHLLSITVPNSAEKIIDEFRVSVDELPEVTQKLMVEAIDASLIRLRRIEEKLERLRNSLLSEIGGDKR
jgi:7-keto-8-aminopelargonate synthetase-like enzyme